MKRLTIITLLFLLIFPTGAFGASVVQGSVVDVGEDRLNSNPTRTLEFVCVGNPDNETEVPSAAWNEYIYTYQANAASDCLSIRRSNPSQTSWSFYVDDVSVEKITNAAFINGAAYGGGRASW